MSNPGHRTFDLSAFSPVVAELLREQRLAPLGPGSPDARARERLRSLDLAAHFASRQITDRDMASACLAGLWLYFDCLDESHEISQSLGSTTGSYWHALMHRREPDASNSKYWFRRVGHHAIFDDLARDAAELGYLGMGMKWDPFAFVDHCEEFRGTGSASEETCRRVQLCEWQLLFSY